MTDPTKETKSRPRRLEKPRKRVASITHEDDDGSPLRTIRVKSVTQGDEDTDGRPVWHAYGYKWIAARAGCDVQGVRDAVCRGLLDPKDPIAVVAYIARRRGMGEVADALEFL